MTAEAKNLEVISKAIDWHAKHCEAALVEVQMNPFEVKRLDWPEVRGVPIVADEGIGTGRFRLVCSGLHDDGVVEGADAVSNRELITA